MQNIKTTLPHSLLMDRYILILEAAKEDPLRDHQRLSNKNLLWMCKEIQKMEKEWPGDKTGRWCGFIQGVMAMKNLIYVDEERELSRPVFHKYYKDTKTNIPETLSRDN